MSDSEDEQPQLPADTLAILNEFYSEQADREERMKNVAQSNSLQLHDINFQENWVKFLFFSFLNSFLKSDYLQKYAVRLGCHTTPC